MKKPEHNPLLPFPESSLKHDTYDGVTLDLTSIVTQTRSTSSSTTSYDAETFSDMIGKALGIWTEEQKKGVWLKIPTTHSHLIAPATQTHGFEFRHAEPGYCVLTKWLPRESKSRLPHGPTHQVGIGALVIHPTDGKMLVVQERAGPAARRKLWKMPTGLTDPGEDSEFLPRDAACQMSVLGCLALISTLSETSTVAAAAERELREETGLDCTFDRILCFRQTHGGLFNRSDLFFVCLCKLAPEYEERLRNGKGEVELLPQEEEILEAKWMLIQDYANQSLWQESPFYQEMNAAMIRAAEGVYGGGEENSHGFVGKHLPLGYRPGSETLYVSSKL